MSIDQYGIHLGPLYIHFYGLILMSGVVAGAYLAERIAKERKMHTEFIWDILVWVVVAGIVGGCACIGLWPRSPAAALDRPHHCCAVDRSPRLGGAAAFR